MKTMYLRLGLFVFSILLYGTTLKFDFVLDDFAIIINHSHVTQGVSGLDDIWSTNYLHGLSEFNDGLYRPLTPSVFALIYHLFGAEPQWFHLVNMLLYAGLVVLVFEMFQKVFKLSPINSVLAAALFVVIPVHTEVVANIKSLDEIAALFFGIWALLQGSKYVQTTQSKNFGLALLFMLLALFSKESALTFVVVVPMVWFFMHPTQRAAVYKLAGAFAGAAVVFLAIRSSVLNSMPNAVDEGTLGGLNNILLDTSFSERWGTALWLQLMYIQKAVLPYNLLYDYSFNQIALVELASVQALAALAVIGACAFWFFKSIKHQPIIAVGLFWYFATLGVVSNIVVLIGATFAERFLFAPTLGVVIVLAGVLQSQKWVSAKVARGAFVGLIGVYAVLTLVRIPAWKDNFTLYTTDYEAGVNSARVNYNYATVHQQQYATATNPSDKQYLFNEGSKAFKKAIIIYPDYWDAYNNYGTLLNEAGQFTDAIVIFKKLTELKPDYQKGWYNLGLAYYNNKNMQKASNAFVSYCELNPTNAEAWYMAGFCAGAVNQFDVAKGYLERSEQLNPNNPECLMLLGNVHGIQGNYPLAIQYFTRVLQIQPNHAQAQQALALTQQKM